MTQSHQTVLSKFCVCFFILLVVGLFPNCIARAQTPELSVLLTDGFRGRFQSDPYYFGLDAFEAPIRQRREQIGLRRVITVNIGNTVAPFYLSRMDNGGSMIKALASLGYDAMVPGNYEFEYGTDFFTSTDTTGETGELSFVCANILKPDGTPFLPPYRVFDRNGLKVAVVGVMDVEMRRYILDENFAIPTGELQLADPTAVLNDLIPKVRKVSDFIILISNAPFEVNIVLANRVNGINLVVSAEGEKAPTRYVEMIKPIDDEFISTYIRTTAPERIKQFDFARGDYGFEVVNIDRIIVEAPQRPSPMLRGIIETLEARFKNYCQQRFQHDPDATLIQLSPETKAADLARFVVYVMMNRTHSELGMIHQGHFDFSYWEAALADGKLTIRECFLLMPENHGLQTLCLTGRRLNQLAAQKQTEKAAGRDYLYFLSVKPVLAEGDVQWFVHGLPIRDDEAYASCTINVLTNGVPAFSPITQGTHIKTKFKMAKHLRVSPDGETKVVRDVLIDYLVGDSQDKMLPIGPQLAAKSYLQRTMWRLMIQDANVMFNLNRSQNTETYRTVTIPELRKPEITGLRLGGELSVTRETKSLLWTNTVRTTLGTVKIGEESFKADQDDFNVDTFLLFGALKFAGLTPGFMLGFDTEYVKADEVPRQLDLLIAAGVGLPNVWQFSDSRFVYVRIIDLNGGDARRKGLNALEFKTQLVAPYGRLRWKNRLNGTYYLPDDSANSERRQFLINATSQLNIPLIGNLAFAPAFQAVLFKGQDESTVAQEYMFSFRLSYFKDWKWQYQPYFLRAE